MFFVDFRFEELPEDIKDKVNELHLLDRKIFELNKIGRKINFLVVYYCLSSCEVFLEFKDKFDKKTTNYIIESIGEIPIMFFYIDNLKVDREVKEIISSLVDLADSNVLKEKEVNKLIEEVCKNLRKLQPSFEREDVSLNFEYSQIFEISTINKILKRKIKSLKGKYSKLAQYKENRALENIILEYFVELVNIYLEYREKSILNILENSIFFLYLKKQFIDQKLWNIIKPIIDVNEFKNTETFLEKELHKLKNIKNAT